MKCASASSFLLLAALAHGPLACTVPSSADAGPPAFEPVPLEGGFTGCGDVVCQPGQRCEAEGLCYLGCERDRECAPGEVCDFYPSTGGVCAPPDIADCGDGLCSLGEHAGTCPDDCPGIVCDDAEAGQLSCGDTTCGPGFYCANPAEGLCYEGCISVANCGCGRRCNATAGQPGNCTVPIAPDVPVCGDGECHESESARTCLEDCSWSEQCVRECTELGSAGCFSPGEDALCSTACLRSTDVEREAFSLCIFLGGGTGACPTDCTDELGDGLGFDAGLP